MSGNTDDWQEAGGSKPAAPAQAPPISLMSATDPKNDPRYVAILEDLERWHGELLKMNFVENPAVIGDYLSKIRLNCNLLFRYINVFIDQLADVEVEVAAKRQQLYEDMLALGKTPSASEAHAREMSRSDEALAKLISRRIDQITNEYERYNGIAMHLQSRMREFDTERRMG